MTRIFTTFSEMYPEVKRDLRSFGITYQSDTFQDKDVHDNDEFLTQELQDYSFEITRPSSNSQFAAQQGLSLPYINQEFKDRTGGISLNPGKAWLHRPDVWRQFLEMPESEYEKTQVANDPALLHFSYTYSGRIGKQLNQIIELLKAHRFSRQAIVSIYESSTDLPRSGGKRRVPCSMNYQFLIRPSEEGDVMHMHYHMRSCDIITHFPYDVVLASMIQMWVAKKLSVGVGHFHFHAVSLHAFKKDIVRYF